MYEQLTHIDIYESGIKSKSIKNEEKRIKDQKPYKNKWLYNINKHLFS